MNSSQLPLVAFLAFAVPGAPAQAGVTFPVEIPFDGRFSLAVYDREGRMVRTLATGKPAPIGEFPASWDGLDRYGRMLPAGEYTWKLVATEGLRAEFITQVGQNVEPVWERATGNHTAPNSVAVDATGLYRLGAENEGAHWGVKTDLEGRHVWTNDRWSASPWVQGTLAVTLVGGRLFELMPNGHIYGYDAATGRVFTGGDFDPKPWIGRWEGFEAAQAVKDDERRKQNAAASPRFMAGDEANGWLVLAFPQHDAVAWLDAANGRLLDTAKSLPKRIRPCAASASRDNKSKAYLWCDLNDDGLASDDEVQWLKNGKLGGWVNPGDLALRSTPTATDYNPGPLLRPVRVTPGGTPVLDAGKSGAVAPWQENGTGYFPGDYRLAPDGSLFACFSDGTKNPHEGSETHGAWYYNSCSAIDRLVKWSADGKQLWSVGRHSPDNDHETGSTAMPRGLVGFTHGCIVWGDASDEETARPTVWTEDGLYVDELRLPDSNYRISFWFKTAAENIRLCEAKRYSSYNNRWSDHVIELDQGLLRFSLKGDEPLSTTTKVNDGKWHHVISTVGLPGQQLFVDGKLIATGKLARRQHTSNRLGLDLGPGGGVGTVTMDEVRVLGRTFRSEGSKQAGEPFGALRHEGAE